MAYISPKAKVLSGSISNEVVVLGGPSIINEGTIIEPFVVIGHPIRAKLMNMRNRTNLNELMSENSNGAVIGKECIIRSNVIIYEDVEVGNNVETGHNALIRERTKIGSGTRIGSGVIIDGETVIGSNVSVQSMVYIPRGTVIEDNVFLGPNVVITNDKYPPSKRLDGVRIRRNAVIGG